MPITQETKLYEILIRYNRDGLQGSHAIDCEYLMDGDTILRQTEQPARPVTEAELTALVGAQTAALTAQVTAMTAAGAQHETAMTEKDAAVTAAETAQAQAEAAVAAKQSEIDALGLTHAEALAVKQAEIDALQAQLNPVDAAGFAVLSPIQIRLALLGAGITSATIDGVVAAIEDAAQRETASFYWEYSREYHRDHPLITQFAAALSLTDDQVDALWAQAATL